MTDTKNDITASSAASTGASENDVSGTAPEDDCDSDVEMEGASFVVTPSSFNCMKIV